MTDHVKSLLGLCFQINSNLLQCGFRFRLEGRFIEIELDSIQFDAAIFQYAGAYRFRIDDNPSSLRLLDFDHVNQGADPVIAKLINGDNHISGARGSLFTSDNGAPATGCRRAAHHFVDRAGRVVPGVAEKQHLTPFAAAGVRAATTRGLEAFGQNLESRLGERVPVVFVDFAVTTDTAVESVIDASDSALGIDGFFDLSISGNRANGNAVRPVVIDAIPLDNGLRALVQFDSMKILFIIKWLLLKAAHFPHRETRRNSRRNGIMTGFSPCSR